MAIYKSALCPTSSTAALAFSSEPTSSHSGLRIIIIIDNNNNNFLANRVYGNDFAQHIPLRKPRRSQNKLKPIPDYHYHPD